MSALPLAATAAAAGCFGVASVLQRVGARRVPLTERFDPRLLVRLARQPPYAAGLVLDAVGFALTAWALHALPLFAVQAGVAASLAVTAVLSAAVLHEPLAPSACGAVAAAGLGLVMLAASADEHQASPSGLLVPALLAGVPAVLAAAAVLHRRTPVGTGVGFGVLAGVAFAGFALCGRVLGPLGAGTPVDPAAWALVGYLLAGVLLYGTSLQRGSVTAVTAAYVAVEVVVPAVVGLTLLGDAPRAGTRGWAATGFVLVVAAVIALSRQGGVGPAAPLAAPAPTAGTTTTRAPVGRGSSPGAALGTAGGDGRDTAGG